MAIQPKNFTLDELAQERYRARRAFYGRMPILRRMFDLCTHARRPGNLAFFLMTNRKNRRKRSLAAEAESLPSRLPAVGAEA